MRVKRKASAALYLKLKTLGPWKPLLLGNNEAQIKKSYQPSAISRKPPNRTRENISAER